MKKAIELAKKITRDYAKDWSEELWDYNFPPSFKDIYSVSDVETSNKIICYIVYSYSPDSLWLDLNRDRVENKTLIFNNLGTNVKDALIISILENKSELVNVAIFDFLESLKNWKWKAIFELIEYSSKMFAFASQETEAERNYQKINKEGEVKDIKEDLEIDLISKVNKEKGILLDAAISKRKQADILLKEIKTEFVVTDNATQQDFGVEFTETAQKKNILSWREFIKYDYPLILAKQKTMQG